jgi:hypothetical protein
MCVIAFRSSSGGIVTSVVFPVGSTRSANWPRRLGGSAPHGSSLSVKSTNTGPLGRSTTAMAWSN